jgi:hypothetical protein
MISYGRPNVLCNPFGDLFGGGGSSGGIGNPSGQGSGIANSTSSTSATDAKITATDDAEVVTGGSTLVETGGLAQGANAVYTAPGALNVAGPVTGTITIEAADAQVLSKVLDTVAQITDAQTHTLNDTIASNAELAKGKQTDGETYRNNTIMWITLGVLGLLGVVFYGKPK